MATPEWKQYEQEITDLIESRASGPVEVLADVEVPGRLSEAMRPVDILVMGSFAGASRAVMVVDCKCCARRVEVEDVEGFLGMLDDLDVRLGMLVTSEGYSEAAIKRTQRITRKTGPLVNIAMLGEAATWWLLSARSAGAYYTETVRRKGHRTGCRLLVFSSRPNDEGDFHTDILWSAPEADWDDEDLTHTLAQLVLSHRLGRHSSPPEVERVEPALSELISGNMRVDASRVDEWLDG